MSFSGALKGFSMLFSSVKSELIASLRHSERWWKDGAHRDELCSRTQQGARWEAVGGLPDLRRGWF